MLSAEILTLREKVTSCRVLRHRYFEELSRADDETAKRLIRALIQMDAPVAHQFPQLIGAMIAESTDIRVRMALVENLWDECGNGDVALAHTRLFDDMAASVGLPEMPQQSSETH